jgi:threonine dehydratase
LTRQNNSATKADMTVNLADIKAAARAIKGAVERTPCHHSKTLSKLTGAEIYLKFDNLQFTASFKERGALNKLLSLSPEERRRGVIAMSVGNHAQAVAYHASQLQIAATIVMPEFAPFVKVKYTQEHGAKVVLKGKSLTDAFNHAQELAQKDGLIFVHPYDDDRVIAGAGTMALEMLEEFPELDCLVIPIGGGGLIAGSTIAAKGIKPEIEVYGVETELFPMMRNAVTGETRIAGGQTIAEGIAVLSMGQRCVPVVKEGVKEILLVPEETIETAIGLLLNVEKTVVEGAGAAGFAAVLHRPELFRGKKAGLALCGGNIDPRLLSTVILRELSREGRILNMSIEIEDRPGILARIAQIVGEAGGNIIEVSHNRMLTHMPAKIAELRMSVEARDQEHAREIVAKIQADGFRLMRLGGEG